MAVVSDMVVVALQVAHLVPLGTRARGLYFPSGGNLARQNEKIPWNFLERSIPFPENTSHESDRWR